MESHLERLRLFEHALATVLLRRWCPRGRDLLEIGGGTGFQASLFARDGYRVCAVELPGMEEVWRRVAPPLVIYDGHRLPFRAKSFDVVFSSNVLEHVAPLDVLEAEIRRVLRDNGIVLHVLPTPVWRVATSLTWPVYLLKRAASIVLSEKGVRSLTRGGELAVEGHHPLALIARVFPHRPGVRGTTWTDTWYFSRSWWRRHFASASWRVLDVRPMGLFYTGNEILGSRLPMAVRRMLGAIFGSVTCAWVLSKGEASTQVPVGVTG
jgi:SAM-dependent methyltransferase